MTPATPSTLLAPFGDRAARFVVPAGAARRRLLAELSAISGVRDVVLAEEIGCVVFDESPSVGAAREAIERLLARSDRPASEDAGATHAIRVVYDGDDLESVAAAIGQSKESVVALHSAAEYRVAMLGFLPGFAYLRGLPRELCLPRRAPRPRVPANSVAIAAEYGGVYPFPSPGGWHLLGRATGFEAFGARGAALAIGDVVRFVPAPRDEIEPAPTRTPPAASSKAPLDRPHLEITRAAAIALLVDGGRAGRMHEGVPPGGPLVRSLLARANEHAGNPSDACGVEIYGTIQVTARVGPVTIADDASGPITLREGEQHVVSTEGRMRARYLALAGGVDAPVVLGSRGALLVAGIGGVLRRGDRLAPDPGGSPRQPRGSGRAELAPDAPIPILPGPDAADVALDDLARHDLRIAAASDRTGTRLEGPSLARRSSDAPAGSAMSRRSTPMVMGAIELTPSGLIVLGPDHPTTGGYPVVALVPSSFLDGLFARPIGSAVRFAMT